MLFIKNGDKNNKKPVNLFEYVCKKVNSLYFFMTIINDIILTNEIIIIYAICFKNVSNIMINIIIKNKKSEILSNLAPNLLSVLVFLATYPSNISVNPQIEYIVKNNGLYFSMNSKLNYKIILDNVIIFAKFNIF